MPSRLAALLAMMSPSTDSAAALGSVEVANTSGTRAAPGRFGRAPPRRSFLVASPRAKVRRRAGRVAARRAVAAGAHDEAITRMYKSRTCRARARLPGKCGRADGPAAF